MEAVKYPIETTQQGDLLTEVSPSGIAVTRGFLLVDIKIGERQLLSEYGNDLYPFMPNVGSSDLEAQILQSALNLWCIEEGDLYQFSIENRSTDKIDFYVNVVFPE